MFFHLVTIQIVFLPTISTGSPIYVFSNIHELFSWICIFTYFLYIYKFWSIKNACLYYFRGISLSLSHYIILMCIIFVFIYLTYIYNLLMPFFFPPLRLALTTNRFHTKQKTQLCCHHFFFFKFLRDIEGE